MFVCLFPSHSDSNGEVCFQDLVRLNRHVPQALSPLFNFQHRLRIATFGQSPWRRISDRVYSVLREKPVGEVFSSLPDCYMSVTADE